MRETEKDCVLGRGRAGAGTQKVVKVTSHSWTEGERGSKTAVISNWDKNQQIREEQAGGTQRWWGPVD